MISRILGILFFGSIFALVPVALVIAGIREGYIDFYPIKDCGRQVFYNPFFYDTIFHSGFGWVMLLIAVIVGTLIVYPPFWASLWRGLYALTLVVAMCAFIPKVGFALGEAMFHKPNTRVTLIDGQTLSLDVVYVGREGLHFLTPDKPYPLTYRWEAIVGGQQQRCYVELSDSQPPQLPQPLDTRGASAAEAAAVGIEPLPEKKSMFDVLMKKLFP